MLGIAFIDSLVIELGGRKRGYATVFAVSGVLSEVPELSVESSDLSTSGLHESYGTRDRCENFPREGLYQVVSRNGHSLIWSPDGPLRDPLREEGGSTTS